MSGYKQVRSSSPSRETNEGEGFHELKEDKRSIDDIDVEQNERLLRRDEEEEDDVEADQPKTLGPAEKRIMYLIGLLTFLGLLVTVALVYFIRIYFKGGGDEFFPVSDADFRRPSSDYVLDQSWDFGAPPQTREYNWVLENIKANPDGVFRPIIAINGKFPGEMIRANEGDTIVVNVENRLGNATAIHWHGLLQNGSNWMDGTPGVTQCPIAPGKTFKYEFEVVGQSGTYFYHGHQAAQGHDGLIGPIVIHSRQEKALAQIPYASDRVIMVQDWYYDLSSALLKQKLSPGSETSPVPNGALVNGANRVDCSLHPTRRCDSSLASLAELDLQPDADHRLRILNTGAFAWFEVTVDDHHNLSTIEVDGIGVEPTHENGLLVGPGQRYSVVLSTNQTSADDAFWLRARMLKHCFAENVLPEHGFAEAKAVVRYTSSSSANTASQKVLPTTENDSGRYTVECKDPPVDKYKPYPSLAAPASADHSWYFRVNLEIGNWRLERGFINGSTLRPNLKSPSLHRVLDGLAARNESFLVEGVNTRAFDTKHELVVSNTQAEVVDVVLQNFDEGNHPFHLHGHQFFILSAGHGYFPGYAALGMAPEGKGLLDPKNDTIIHNPLRRDVATVEGFGWVLIRFVADNPGLWLFHCHMIWHAESGMGMQFLSRIDMLQNMTLPMANAGLCQASVEELEKGAAPKDSIFYGKPA